jgi:hypothetical protein
MRSLALVLYIFFNSTVISAKGCPNIEKMATRAIESNKVMNAQRIKGPLRSYLNKFIDSGIDVSPQFFRDLKLRSTFSVKGFKTRDKKADHVKEHMDSFGVTTVKQYEKRAKSFAISHEPEIINIKTQTEIFRLNPLTGEYLIIDTRSMNISTYFKPDLKVINTRRSVNGQPRLTSVLEWFIENKWKRSNAVAQ